MKYDRLINLIQIGLDVVSKELNHLATIWHVYAGVWISWSKKKVIIFQKENGNTFTLLIIFIVKSLRKEQNSTNLLLWPQIYWNKSAITPKWFNSLDTNSRLRTELLICFRECKIYINISAWPMSMFFAWLTTPSKLSK